ncbi:MAG: GNAT family N-acetyltransferase [Sphingobacteriaceae bacterium]|nr:GNAT family N-acetyltransferase [Cytophagaceae bacterium]
MTNVVQLREVAETDLSILFEHQCDPEANRMADFPARDWEAFTTHWARVLRDESAAKKTILFDGQVAGHMGSFERFGSREVGYWLGREYWGKGITTQALTAFLVVDPTRPLLARVATHNVASRRVLEKCGFVLFGEEVWFPEVGGEPSEDFILKLYAETTFESP